MNMEEFQILVKTALKSGASDIHLRELEKPYLRIKGELKSVKSQELSRENMQSLVSILLPDNDLSLGHKEIDGSFEIPEVARLRFNIFKHQGKLGIILRLIHWKIPSLKELEVSPAIQKIVKLGQGLVLVTGATGSGKSTTMASMVNEINENSALHVLTIEDPIEFVHIPKKARITQREIGVDTENFESALRSALRQDPDVILIGEMRDSQTVSTALKAAETGHLVFGTMHTSDAYSTVTRLISMFPPEEQAATRLRLAEGLKAVVCQRLLKRKDNTGMVVAQEIMQSTPGIAEAIGDPKKIDDIYIYIEKGGQSGDMHTFDQYLLQLYEKDLITLEEAMSHASSPEDFKRNLQFSNSKQI